MSATGELRRMLDERGLTYEECEDCTTIYYDRDGSRYTYNVEPKSGWAQLFGYHITPEKAIAATLGAEACHDVSESPFRFECSECGGLSRDIAPRFCPCCGRRVAG